MARQARPSRLLEQVSQGWSFPASCCPSLFPSSPPLHAFPSSPPLQDCSTVPPHPRLRMLTEEGREGHVSLTHVCDFKAVTFPLLDLLFHCGFKGLVPCPRKVMGRDIFRAREGCPTPSPPWPQSPALRQPQGTHGHMLGSQETSVPVLHLPLGQEASPSETQFPHPFN